MRKEEHNRVLEDNLNHLRDEIDNRSDEFSKHRESMSQKLQLTDQKHQKLEKLTRKLNDEYFDQRRNHDFKIKRLQEEKELLKLKGISLEHQYQEALKNKTLENHITKDLAEKRAKEYASQFKSKSLRKEETLEIVREQYKKVKVIYGEKLTALDINLGMMKDATNSMKLGKERAIKREKAANYQARQMLKRLEYEIEARSKGQYFEKEVDQPDYEDDLDEETINLDDLDQLNYKMKSIEKKLMAA